MWCGVMLLEVWLKLVRCVIILCSLCVYYDFCKFWIFKYNNVYFWWVVYVYWNVLWLLEKKIK